MDSHALPRSFCFRFLEVLEPELAGCRFVRRQSYGNGSVLLAVIVDIEGVFQDDPACCSYRRRSPQNETLFCEPGRFYVDESYRIHHCVKDAVTQKSSGWS
ncbi:DNA-3-methyladenine glycosylase [Synechococcus sp. UW179A]|uniref:DNA-3-methyladenine glycosylase n=1 Tax=Synechococcus sp. UW179A TaxID=2575510 RepID=UPI000E0F13FB|nr:DNA-3-methyladenine glycosylase [Synechococcus sp. UW179A]